MANETDINLNLKELPAFYEKYFGYFRTLNDYWKKIFVIRCLNFTSDKIITGAEGFVPNNKVKAIVAASAVQLTLGLETWKLDYFDTIIIHPKDFDSKTSGLRQKGETNLSGHIRLSWKSFISGYLVENDNVNLGLHEFTHALRFNPFRGFEQDYFIEHYFNAWLASANEAYNDIRKNKETIFRKYGGANINEFMSVCIEHFFESPQEIKQKYPLLFYSTAIMLNQYVANGLTEINIRQKLFAEKNNLIRLRNSYNISTNWRSTSSMKIMTVIAMPLLYTAIVTGLGSGATILLGLLLLAEYMRFDYYYIKTRLENSSFNLQKGFLIFRNRRRINIRLSQIISVRLSGNGSGSSECEFIYYDTHERSFYSDNIPAGRTFSNDFLNDMVSCRIATFKS